MAGRLTLLSGFAAIALVLVLASVGIYGAMSHLVRQPTRAIRSGSRRRPRPRASRAADVAGSPPRGVH